MHDVAFIVTVADHDAVGGVEVSRRRSVSSGIRRVDLQDLTHLPATRYSEIPKRILSSRSDIYLFCSLTARHAPSLPVSVTSCQLYGLSGEEAVLDEHVDVLTEVRQSAAAAYSREVEQRHQQRGREALQTLPGAPFAIHGLQIGEAGSTREGAAPHQAVAQDGPLEELTAERTSNSDGGD